MGVMMQYFEYNLKYQDHLWRSMIYELEHLSELGITALWLPPAFKGASGKNDVGYGAYDLYDLGEFNAKRTISTKYGTKDEYLYAIAMCHHYHIDVYPDIVMNHKMGADNVNLVKARTVSATNRNHITSKPKKILAPTQFNYYARNNQYSAFKWTADHFTGVDYDFISHQRKIYLLENKSWSENVDDEFSNYDYLMGSDVDVNYPDVRNELIYFGKWYRDMTHLDGFRLDALKHIDASFIKDWLNEVREGQDYFAVGEYWSGELNRLIRYLEKVDYCMSLFDVPLHYHFYEASKHPETYDLRNLFKDTLVSLNPIHAVTFVDNHDTQPGQGLASFVNKWFKPFAYACVLLRDEGYPCIFYGDYYGLENNAYNGIHNELEKLLLVRKELAYGNQYDYFEEHQLGFSREGGVAVLLNVMQNSHCYMYVGKQFVGKYFYDIFSKHKVLIDASGCGDFKCTKRKLAVYIIR